MYCLFAGVAFVALWEGFNEVDVQGEMVEWGSLSWFSGILNGRG